MMTPEERTRSHVGTSEPATSAVPISVVIPNLHSPIIDQVVVAIERQTVRAQIAEIIVVGLDRPGRVPPHVTWLDTGVPIAPGAARNRGIAHSSTPLVALVDADCLLAPDCLERLLAALSAPRAVVGAALQPEHTAYWLLADNLMAFDGSLTCDESRAAAALPSFVMLLERAAWQRVGGFDPRRFIGEDYDLCFRLRRAGYVVWFEASARVVHRPARASAATVWRHLHQFGRHTPAIIQRYPDMAQARMGPWLRPWAPLVLVVAPLLAAVDVLRRLRQCPGLRRWWYAAPGVIWARCAWYWGVAEAFMSAEPPSDD